MLTRYLQTLFLIGMLFSSSLMFAQCVHCSAPAAPAEYGGAFNRTMYKNAKLQLWAVKPSAPVDGRDWFKVKGAGDTTFVGSGDTLAVTVDTTCKYIARNINNCTCGGTYYSTYSLMSSITVIDSPSVPQYWVNYVPVICSGSQTNIRFGTGSTLSSLSYEYLRNDTNNVSGSTSGSSIGGALGIKLTNKTASPQLVRFMVRMVRAGSFGHYFDCKSFYITVLPDSASTGDHCTFPAKPTPWPFASADVNTYARGASVQFFADTTVMADTVKWYKVVGTDTTFYGIGNSINATIDTPAKYLARNVNICSCDTSLYSSDYTLIANYAVASSVLPNVHLLQYMPTIVSGTGMDIIPRPDTTATIGAILYRDNAYISGSTFESTSINNPSGAQAYDLILTNTTNSSQLVKYYVRTQISVSVYGNTYTGYLTVLPSSVTAPAGNHCKVPDRTYTTSLGFANFIKDATLNLDLCTNVAFGAFAVAHVPNVVDSIEWYKMRGPGDTVFVGSATPVNTTVDTSFSVLAVSRNTCYWSDSSMHIYKSVPTIVSKITKVNGTAVAPTITNSKLDVCNGTGANISAIRAGTNNYVWYRSNVANVTGTATGTANLSATGITINPTLSDTVTTPQKVYFVANTVSSPNYNSQAITSVMVYPDCSKWAGMSTAIHSLKDSICTGDTSTLTADTIPGYGNNTYAWSSGDTNKTIHPTSAGTYTVTVTNACGCSASASKTLTVQALLTPTVNNVSLCPGGIAILTAIGGSSYTWSNSISGPSLATVSAGTYSVTASDQLGCTGTASGTVTLRSNPSAYAGNDTSIVISNSIVLGSSVVASGGSAPYHYLWNQAVYLDTPTKARPLASPLSTGQFILTVIDSNGCFGRDTMSVTVTAGIDSFKLMALTDTVIGIVDSLKHGDTVSILIDYNRIGSNIGDTLIIYSTFDTTCIYSNSISIFYSMNPFPDVSINHPHFPLFVPITTAVDGHLRIIESISTTSDSCISPTGSSDTLHVQWNNRGARYSAPGIPIKINRSIYNRQPRSNPFASNCDMSDPTVFGFFPNCNSCTGSAFLGHDDESYIPQSSDPVKHVYINMIFLHKDDGTGGIDPNSKFAHDLEGFAEYRFYNLQSWYPGQTDITCYDGLIVDPRIRYVFRNIAINSTQYWDNRNDVGGGPSSIYGCPGNGFYINPLDNILRQIPSLIYSNGINAYYTESQDHYNLVNAGLPPTGITGFSCSTSSASCGIDGQNLILNMQHTFTGFKSAQNQNPLTFNPSEQSYNPNNPYWPMIDNMAQGLVHELGHCFFFDVHHKDYCLDNIMSSGFIQRVYLTRHDIGQMHRALTLGTVSKAVAECSPLSGDFEVTDNMVIDYDWRSYRNIVVKSGYTLTVKCRIRMPNGGTITVEPNAKLIVDGGVITNACEGSWQGITVKGDRLQSQYAYSGSNYYQGTFSMIHHGEVSHAVNALVVNSGGIVQVNDGTFRNNRYDVIFDPYLNTQPGTSLVRANSSYFTKANFVTDAPLIGGYSHPIHALLWQVNGINFYGCKFANEDASHSTTSGYDDLGVGIYSFDANFTATGCEPHSTPCSHLDKNKFNNLYQGILATNGASHLGFTSDYNEFNSCTFAIENDGVNGARITRNVINMGLTKGAPCTFGIYFKTGTVFRIEENEFTKQTGANTSTIGTWISNSGEDNNIIYKNIFSGIAISNYSEKQNRSTASVPLQQLNGLSYFCNQQSQSGFFDMLVDRGGGMYGIRPYQGSSLKVAGNLFSSSPIFSGFYNQSLPVIQYFYGTGTHPAPVNPYNVALQSRTAPSAQNTCASNYTKWGTSGYLLPSGKIYLDAKPALESYYGDNDDQYKRLKFSYDSLIDGGNTESLLSEIIATTSLSSLTLRSKLLGLSPFLSLQTLSTFADRTDIFPDSLMFPIFAANPEILHEDSILSYLEQRSPGFDLKMIDSLRHLSDTLSIRGYMEGDFSEYRNERDLSAGILATNALEQVDDSDTLDYGQYRYWIAQRNTVLSDYQIVDNFLALGMVSSADSVFDSIPYKRLLDDREIAEYEALKTVKDIVGDLILDAKSFLEIGEGDKAILADIASGEVSIAQVKACNILRFVDHAECSAEPSFPDTSLVSGARLARPSTENTLSNIEKINGGLTIYPNPSKDRVTVVYEGAMPIGDAIRISDINGRTIFTGFFKSKATLDVSSWEEGSFICTILAGGRTVANRKFVIIR